MMGMNTASVEVEAWYEKKKKHKRGKPMSNETK